MNSQKSREILRQHQSRKAQLADCMFEQQSKRTNDQLAACCTVHLSRLVLISDSMQLHVGLSLGAVWHTWFPLRVWLGQVKRPDVTSNPLALPPSESPRNPQSSLGFSGYKPSFVCPLQHQAQPWCHGYLKRFNWPTIITHSFKKTASTGRNISLLLTWALHIPPGSWTSQSKQNMVPHCRGFLFDFFFSWIYFLSTFWRF